MGRKSWLKRLKTLGLLSFNLSVFFLLVLITLIPTMYYLKIPPFTTLAYFILPVLACEMFSKLLQFAENELITTKNKKIHIQKKLFLTVLSSYLLPLLLTQFYSLLKGGLILKILGIFGFILTTPLAIAFVFHSVRSTGLIAKELFKIFSKELLENFSLVKKFEE